MIAVADTFDGMCDAGSGTEFATIVTAIGGTDARRLTGRDCVRGAAIEVAVGFATALELVGAADSF
jgi:hypothetical protein